MYYVYMLRCMDNSIYTGITTDLERRMNEHFSKCDRCAKYTKTHLAKKLEAVWSCDNKKSASKLEYRIKRLTKIDKEKLVLENSLFCKLLGNVVECELYKREKFV